MRPTTTPIQHTDAYRVLVTEHVDTYALDPAHIQMVCLDLARLREQGTLVRYQITGLAQLFTRALWEELGVPKEDVRAARMTTGVAKLFPAELVNPLDSMQTRFRAWLDRYSHDVMAFRPFRYILKGTGDRANPGGSAYWTWMEKHDELMVQWEMRKHALLEGYADAHQKLRTEYTQIAQEAHQSIYARRGTAWPMPLDEFVDQVVNRAVARFPSREALMEQLAVTIIPGLLLNSADIEQILYQQDRIAMERDAVEIDQFNRLARSLMDMPSPFDAVLNESLGQLYRDAKEMRDAVLRAGHLPGTTRTRMGRLRTTYQLLCPSQDLAVEAALNAIDVALIAPSQNRTTTANVPAVLDALGQMLTACRPAVELLEELRPTVWGGVLDAA